MKPQTLVRSTSGTERSRAKKSSAPEQAASGSGLGAFIANLPPGWPSTWALSIGAIALYVGLGQLVTWTLPYSPEGQMRLHSVIPPLAYYLSAMAFFTAFTLNAVSLVFEDTAAKRQLALLSCLVKGLSCHCDLLLGSTHVIVVVDSFAGAVLLPQHFVQWMVTCPLMLVAIARTSDFTTLQTAKAVAANMTLVVFGFIATMLPMPLAMAPFSMAFCLFCYILKAMHGMMLGSISKDEASASARKSWQGIYWSSFSTWIMFPSCWLLSRFGPALWPGTDLAAEAIVMVANFMAKVVLSSSVVYGNYLTVAQRRLLAQQRAENEERVALVAQLTNAITQKDEFMSLMSHELRTPLNGIIQLSDSLARGGCGDLGEKGRHFAGTIKNSSNHLLNIINDILDAAALKEGRLAIKHERVDLGQAVQHVIDIVTPLARKGVVLEKAIDPSIPVIVADAGRIIQILYNLAGNSLKFTHSGRVTISVRPGGQQHYVVMSVADTGVGIPKDKLGSIFEAFEQVDMSVSRKYGGTGLGLNIVKSLVDAHKGSITVTSEVGKGTEFMVRLPVLQENIRKSLERTIRTSLEHHGINYEKVAASLATTRARRSSVTNNVSRDNSVSLGPSLDMASSARSSSSWTRAVTRTGSAVPGPEPASAAGSSAQNPALSLAPLPEGGVPGKGGKGLAGDMTSEQDMLVKRAMKRSREIDYEHTVTDLVRRTELRRSIVDDEEAAVAGKAPPRKTASNSGLNGGGSGGKQANPYQSTLYRIASGVSNALAGTSPKSALRNASRNEGEPASEASDTDDAPDTRPHARFERHPSARAPSPAPPRSETKHVPPPRPASAPPAGRSRTESSVDDDGEDSCPLTPRTAAGAKSGSGRLPGPSPALQNAAFARRTRGGQGSARGATQEGGRPGSAPEGGGGATGITSMKPSFSVINGTVQILSVDDEEVNQMVLQEILESVGYQFQQAMNGPEALDYLTNSPTLPDLILLDCMMPEMSGHQFVSILRETVPTSVLPVIMVSAKADEKNIVEGLRSGCNDFVRKPYNRQELLARIESLLRVKADSTWMSTILRSSESVAGDGDYNDDDQDGSMGGAFGIGGGGGKRDGKSEALKLLQSILPESIIKRMRSGQQFVADSHPHVCVLFTDIVGFTTLSSQVPTAEVFMMLSNMFTAFDRLVDRFDVYKVETIGDAYMAVAGHEETPDKTAKGTPVYRMLQMARAMLEVVRNFVAPNGQALRIRVGVHCGPAYAGVIGLKCPRYCFLGDTVNTAARMESTGFPMAVHVSDRVVAASETPDDFVEVGTRDVKGKGMMTTYLLKVGEWEGAVTTLQQLAAGLLAHDPTHGDSSDLLTTQPTALLPPLPALPPVQTQVPASKAGGGTEPCASSGTPPSGSPLSAPAVPPTTPAQCVPQQLHPAQLLQPSQQLQPLQQLQPQQQLVLVPAAGGELSLRHEISEQQKRVLQLEALLQASQAEAVSARKREKALEAKLAVGAVGQSTKKLPGSSGLDASLATLLGDGGAASSSGAERSKGAECSVPATSVLQLLAGLGMADVYGPMFEAEAISLDELLQMDAAALRAVGVLPLGHCILIRDAVMNLARSVLSKCDLGYPHEPDNEEDADAALNRFLFGDSGAAVSSNPLFDEGPGSGAQGSGDVTGAALVDLLG